MYYQNVKKIGKLIIANNFNIFKKIRLFYKYFMTDSPHICHIKNESQEVIDSFSVEK